MADVRSLFDLTGRGALITGGSRGLGAEIAEGLAEAGAAIFVLARRAEWLEPQIGAFRARGFTVHGALCDVSDPEQVENVVAEAEEALSGVDVLVNNAGVTWGAPAEQMPLEKWRSVVDVNLTGTFLFSQAVGRRMLERGAGSIVNVASIAGLLGGLGAGDDEVGVAGYSASKAGVMGLTRELAVEWGPRGVRVNAVAPGFFPTRMSAGVLEKIQPEFERVVPLRRVGRAGEIKGTVLFLASEASSYVTGQTLVVDGGRAVV